MGDIGCLTELSLTEMPVSDTFFGGNYTHVHTVDTRRSFFPSLSAGNQANTQGTQQTCSVGVTKVYQYY